jgi:CRP-like cAMP-binding protein
MTNIPQPPALPPSDAASVLQRLAVFQLLPASQLETLARAMTPVALGAGAEVYREDDPGDAFYIVIEGELAVIKRRAAPATGEDALARLGAGDTFGEVALLEHTRRTATVRAVSACRLWRVPGAEFQRLLVGTAGAQRVQEMLQNAAYLGRLPALAGLPADTLMRFAQRWLQACYAAGEPAVRPGSSDARLHLIYDGTFEARTEGQPPMRLRAGDTFGHAASGAVIALEESRCLVLDRTDFDEFAALHPGAGVQLARLWPA